MPPRMRSPERLGLTVYSRHSPEKRSELKTERLQRMPLGDFVWKELRDEFNTYIGLFDETTGKVCRCGHQRNNGAAWIHVPNPLPGERACQPEGVLCDCRGWTPVKSLATRVVADARYVRGAAAAAWHGTRLPRFAPLQTRMTRVYRFVQTRA